MRARMKKEVRRSLAGLKAKSTTTKEALLGGLLRITKRTFVSDLSVSRIPPFLAHVLSLNPKPLPITRIQKSARRFAYPFSPRERDKGLDMKEGKKRERDERDEDIDRVVVVRLEVSQLVCNGIDVVFVEGALSCECHIKCFDPLVAEE